MERERSERSGERAKLAAQISLKGDATQTSQCSTKSILPDVKNKLSTGILIPIDLFCF